MWLTYVLLEWVGRQGPGAWTNRPLLNLLWMCVRRLSVVPWCFASVILSGSVAPPIPSSYHFKSVFPWLWAAVGILTARHWTAFLRSFTSASPVYSTLTHTEGLRAGRSLCHVCKEVRCTRKPWALSARPACFLREFRANFKNRSFLLKLEWKITGP